MVLFKTCNMTILERIWGMSLSFPDLGTSCETDLQWVQMCLQSSSNTIEGSIMIKLRNLIHEISRLPHLRSVRGHLGHFAAKVSCKPASFSSMYTLYLNSLLTFKETFTTLVFWCVHSKWPSTFNFLICISGDGEHSDLGFQATFKWIGPSRFVTC